MKKLEKNFAIKITLLYLIIGILWILLSDKLLFLVTSNQESIRIISTFKGWFFISITSIFLFLLINKSSKKRDALDKLLYDAKQKAEESDHLKSAFLANMSHEIRTPLNAIMGFADLLEGQSMNDDKRIKYTGIIKQRGTDLLNLINDILDLSRIEAGQLKITSRPTSIKTILSEIYDSFNNQENIHAKKPVEFRYTINIAPENDMIMIDQSRLKQILINLINNAFKFTNSGSIEFGCTLDDKNQLLFHVKDTGIGISSEKHAIIFDRFRQVDNSYLTKNHGGTGLGLSISKGLLNLMNGEIWVDSEEKTGSTFYFTVPFIPSTIVSNISASKNKKEYDWSHKNILVVEDDLYNAQYIVETLSATKARIKVAPTGRIALSLMESFDDIDLILMDIKLPDINGFDLTRQIKIKKPKCIIIAQTAYASDQDKTNCMLAGCDNFVTKPIDKKILLEILDTHFNRSRQDTNKALIL